MRTVWWCATAVALLAVTSALRTTQVEGASRYNRRQPSPTAADVRSSTEAEPSEAAPTFKPRSSRRQEIPQRAVQTRSQSKRPLQRIDASTEANPSQPRDERNERYDSKRISSRTRSKNIENITTETPKQREPINRSRSRQGIRKTQYSTLQRSTEISSSITDDKSDTVDRIITARKENNADNQFRRRSSSVQTVEAVAPKKLRGRINTRPNARSLDLDVSGTTNGLSSFEKEPTTARNSDLRNSRKLRYKQRLSETDTNLTGEGITASSVVAPVKSSQKNESIPSQSEIQAPVQIVFAETQPTIQSSTETLSSTPASTTTKATKVLKRPLARGKVNFKPSATAPKVPSTDEISEDDNYPESFKALIQAKNASTQASSPSSESLTLKASQKIYKTHATLSQSNTGTSQNKNSRLRHKLNTQDEIKKDEKQEDKIVVTSPEPVKAKKPEFRPRGTYNPRRRKLTSFSPTTVSTNSLDQSTAKPAYKYNRKFKLTTTESPKKETMERSSVESSTSLKKTFVRPTVYYRKSFNRKSSTTERSSEEKSTNSEVSNLKPKIVPRTSYYSRFRNNKNKTSSVEASKEVINDTISVESKTEDNAEMPLIYTLLNNSAKNNTLVSENQIKDNESKEMFIIAVTSKESQEQNIVSETVNAIEENGHKLVISENPTTVKYHAIYKDPDSINRLENVEPTSGSTTPIVRNLQTGRTTRKRTKSYEKDIDIPNTVTPKTREKNIRKYGDSYLKPSEELSSVISSEPDKVKGRFSSKFRASYLDKPFYKPTVPSVTSTTTVEGEEIDLGPDVNAISFTKTRSKLTSADLKLSESLVKPSHIMNVEATHHSPSVTVSIFDALAEILTSTPKPRLSSTTEVSQNQNTNNDVVKPFNGVSNSINVNSVKGFASQDTTSAGANTNAKLVQNTDQTQNVINRLSVGESTQPLNTEDGKFNPVNTLPSTPLSTPTPTTPISARRPFAIKVLYSEQSTDQSTTAPEPTPVNMASTDLPTTVHNTVSDILISSNNIVSSELTSMLSNNIKNIIENMDSDSKTKLSMDMAKLLKTLIPRALDKLATGADNVDIIPNTTPYSLEDIKDTQNIDITNNIDINTSSTNIVQNVMSDIIVNTDSSIGMTVSLTENPTSAVNSPVNTQQTTSTVSVSSSQTTLTTDIMTATTGTTAEFKPSTTNQISSTTSSALQGTDSVDINSSTIANRPVPIPFLSNFRLWEETTTTPVIPISTLSLPSINNNRPKQNLSPLQIWVLSKKARVLKMIEDLIRQHNNEIATATPVTDLIQTNNIPLSNRLTKIMNSFTSTTESNDSTNETNDPTSSTTIPSSVNPLTISKTPNMASSSTNSGVDQETISTTTLPLATTSETSVLSQIGAIETTTMATILNNIESTTITSTTDEILQTTDKILNRNIDDAQPTTQQENTETTTDSMVTETTTQTNIDTTMLDIETTTDSNTESSNKSSTNETNQNIISSIQNRVSDTTIPKKDYFIFGILPNNTVVRKNPNDDVLESLTEASPYIIYGVLPNNTVIRRFPNGTRVPRVMQKIDILPISPWSLRNPYSPIHNNPAIVRPESNPIRVSTNTVTSTDTSNNGTDRLTTDNVNNLQHMISSSALNIKDSSSLGITTATNKSPAEKSTASHVLSLRTTTMLPSVDEILLNSISTAAKEEMVISSMTSSTHEPRILTLDIDPETKQIRTEKPSDGTGSAVFKFIPIDEVTLAPQNSNVLKLATKTVTTDISMNTASTVTETNTQTPQVQTSKAEDATTSISITMGTPIITEVTESSTSATTITTTTFAPAITTTEAPTSVFASTTRVPTTSTTESAPITLTTEAATNMPTTVSSTFPPTTIPISTITAEEKKRYQEDTQFLQQLLLGTTDPKNFNIQSNSNLFTDLTTTALPSTTVVSLSARQIEEAKLLQALLSAGQNPIVTNTQRNVKGTVSKTTTSRSIDADLKQLEEDTKFLKALLQATGQNPANFNLPTFDIKTTTRAAVPSTTTTTTTTRPTTTTTVPTTTLGTTTSIDADIKKLKEDTKLLQALLQAVGQNPINNPSPPIITGVTSNVRIASNPLTTSLGSNPTTPINVRPVYTSQSTTQAPPQTLVPRTVLNTLQPTTTEAVRISTTINPRRPTTTRSVRPTTVSARKAQVSGGASTTEMPSTSTFSVEEDLVFLKNLKSVLKANPNNDDPEAALANRIIALAVERSLNEIQTGTSPDVRTGKKIANNVNNVIPTTTPRTTTARTTSTTTTTTTTTTTPSTTTVIASNPSLEADIKQFQEDTKLLQALIKATGQDPSQFNIPTLPPLTNVKVSPNIKPEINTDLKVLSNLLTSPSPLTEQFDSITQKPKRGQTKYNDTTDLPFGAKIAVKDDLQTVQDDAKLLKTLVKLQDVRPTTTQRNKLALTGHTSDEALKKLLQQQSPKSGMVSEATQPPMSLSTEYGKSNDALLAALLKEQGFGPTTALLNQVVVTPKARRTTTPPPPPPPRRPILDGLAWLWQQWRETAPGPTAARPNRRPSPSASPSVATSAATSNRVNWFGSGPFVGNAEDKPSPNRIPLEPPGAVTSEQTPGRGQLVSAAINVTRAFSQFLGAAIQGAAQTVQSVIRAGQRAASDVYVNGSGGSG
ncbi:mucin-2-like isoform X3 [Plodia interpunctella]|uniref:mucin-2-like isoform X3 n=1 Tax=Plodia interpunctella TaxID=58824 RepID=UPI0023675AFE|nr:mucin-17-like isoform X3 [Plodia interpunctella]